MKTPFLIILFIGTNLLYSQVPIGVKFDINGQNMNGYYDPLVYSPDKKVSVLHFSESYEYGYYYNKAGEKIKGQILFDSDMILFKKKSDDIREKIMPDEIKCCVIGVDSFLAISNYYFKNKFETDHKFAQFIAGFN